MPPAVREGRALRVATQRAVQNHEAPGCRVDVVTRMRHWRLIRTEEVLRPEHFVLVRKSPDETPWPRLARMGLYRSILRIDSEVQILHRKGHIQASPLFPTQRSLCQPRNFIMERCRVDRGGP